MLGKKLNAKPYQGIIIFVVIMAILILLTPLQVKYGMYGVAITELCLLSLSIFAAFLYKDSIKKILPFSIPSLRQMIGVFIFWGASFLLNILLMLVLQFYFPKVVEVSQALANVFSSVNLGTALFIGAVLPAICEEVMHRGVILHTFKNVDNKWVKVISMGLIFGVFHLSPYRFVPTAMLGLILTYIMIVTENITLAMLFHFLNNAFAITISYMGSSMNSGAAESPVLTKDILIVAIGSYLFIGAAIPFLFLWASKLIKPRVKLNTDEVTIPLKKSKKPLIACIIIAVLMFLSGIAIIASNMNAVMNIGV